MLQFVLGSAYEVAKLRRHYTVDLRVTVLLEDKAIYARKARRVAVGSPVYFENLLQFLGFE